MRLLCVSFCLTACLCGEIIDRVAITIGTRVITELQIDEELRVTALLNHKPVARDRNARREAADRLVEQFLIRREIDLSRYPLPTTRELQDYVTQVESDFGGPEALKRTLPAYELDSDTLTEHLTLQLTALRFIEYRFRSDLLVTNSGIEAYYAREIAEAKASHTAAPPPLDESRESIRQILTAEGTDEALDAWLEEARKRVNIFYRDTSLQ